MKSKMIWTLPIAAFAAAMLGMAISGTAWTMKSSRSTALQAGGPTITVG